MHRMASAAAIKVCVSFFFFGSASFCSTTLLLVLRGHDGGRIILEDNTYVHCTYRSSGASLILTFAIIGAAAAPFHIFHYKTRTLCTLPHTHSLHTKSSGKKNNFRSRTLCYIYKHKLHKQTRARAQKTIYISRYIAYCRATSSARERERVSDTRAGYAARTAIIVRSPRCDSLARSLGFPPTRTRPRYRPGDSAERRQIRAAPQRAHAKRAYIYK